MHNTRRTYWRVCYVAAIVVSALTFTPLVTPLGSYRPMLGGVPYTLWAGTVVAVLLVLLTFAATKVFPVDDAPRRDAA